ncbi:hypothetical protein STSO111631_13275 [Stackebrandtia soli]
MRSAHEPADLAPKPLERHLRVAIGLTPEGEPLELDLKTYSDNGMGPHGMMIGTPGCGKREALRGIVSGLAVSHTPEEVTFLLIDFKDGAGFERFERLPHIRAIVRNLQWQPAMLDWIDYGIYAEFDKRQKLLAKGNFATRTEYENAREAGQPLNPLPSLLIVIDGFSDLIGENPDFMSSLINIGRLGRSLGVHMLLATDHLDFFRIRGLDGYLRYRIGMRTLSADESKMVMGVADAHELPDAPGHAYLRVGTDRMIRFRFSQVDEP